MKSKIKQYNQKKNHTINTPMKWTTPHNKMHNLILQNTQDDFPLKGVKEKTFQDFPINRMGLFIPLHCLKEKGVES